mmetsp:Transcript_37541/g.90554  ORF Transcript_37541/g.90554 Transcript_37541/m.90554 type:complete len:252 (-) Transcript_37541:771-1526(-)
MPVPSSVAPSSATISGAARPSSSGEAAASSISRLAAASSSRRTSSSASCSRAYAVVICAPTGPASAAISDRHASSILTISSRLLRASDAFFDPHEPSSSALRPDTASSRAFRRASCSACAFRTRSSSSLANRSSSSASFLFRRSSSAFSSSWIALTSFRLDMASFPFVLILDSMTPMALVICIFEGRGTPSVSEEKLTSANFTMAATMSSALRIFPISPREEQLRDLGRLSFSAAARACAFLAATAASRSI